MIHLETQLELMSRQSSEHTDIRELLKLSRSHYGNGPVYESIEGQVK